MYFLLQINYLIKIFVGYSKNLIVAIISNDYVAEKNVGFTKNMNFIVKFVDRSKF